MMNGANQRPLPTITDLNRPFWDACARHELRMQRCTRCGHIRWPIEGVCPRCLSREADWIVLSGRGTVFSFVVFHRAYHPAFSNDVPYNVALVELEEGPLMISNVIGVAPDAVYIGMPVEVVFVEIAPGIWLPKFRPRAVFP